MPAPAIMIAKVRNMQPSRPPRGGWGYLAGSQWRHIDLNGALFAQSGGGKATLLAPPRQLQLSPRTPSFGSRWATPPSLIQQRPGQSRHLPHLKLIYPLMMQAGSALRRRSRLRNRRHCEKHAEGARRRAMSRMRRNPPGVDPKLLIKDAARLMPDPTRRLFLRGGASLGALA